MTGFGVIDSTPNGFQAIDYGCIRPPARLMLSQRYLIIYEGLEALISKYKPDALVVETQYVRKNPQAAIKLGMARGMAVLAAKRSQMSVYEYDPRKTKQAVVGNGNASKRQVQWMIQKLLNLSQLPEPEDAADALALALCHAQAMRRPARQPKEF